jgi:alkanesulfonate monooxygenase SsuD/methylene tetrahydromethanopterin reductase-like flavin-dependent oxidoreductase (luciferase family)
VKLSIELPVAEADAIASCARAIEAAGFDACFVTDHPAPPRAWLEHGGHATMDPFGVLAVAAAVTSTLRLHTHCVIPAYRHPLLTAKAVATLDALSRGRVILGVAVGYLEEEFTALGVPFGDRASLLDDALHVMKAA